MIILIPIVLLCVLIFLYFSYIFNSRTVRIQSGESVRKYIVNGSTTKSQKAPLLVVLHGYGDHPRLIELYSGFSRLAQKEQFIVVYPYGTNTSKNKKLSWNAGSCCNPALEQQIDDVAFIESVIRDVSNNYNVDPNRIYITGFSNGAMMANRMMAEKTHLFAAGAIVGGSIGGKVNESQEYYTASAPNNPLPVVLIHGQKDNIVPFQGGKNKQNDGEFSSFQETVDFWISNNKCQKDFVESDTVVLNKKQYSDCEGRTVVVVNTIKNSGHTWFGNHWQILMNPFQPHFYTSREIWDFVKTKNNIAVDVNGF